MEYSKEQKEELRRTIKRELSKIPGGQKIHLDKEILDILIFDTVIEELNYKCGDLSGKKVEVKYPVCTGPFLRKLDLSEVSFENVIWEWNYEPDDYFESKNTYWRFSETNLINFSKTNAKIDFSKSFAAKLIGHKTNQDIAIVQCNFDGVDLSNIVLGNKCGLYLANSKFKNTGIDINLDSKHIISMHYCDFRGSNFSKYTVSERFFDDVSEGCNYSNTGLNIKTSKNLEQRYERKIAEEESFGNLYGCYLNGAHILIHSHDQTANSQLKKEKKQLQYSSDLIKSVSNEIRSQAYRKIK